MRTTEFNVNLIEGYFRMLDNLNPNNKIDLITKLTQSLKSDLKHKHKAFLESFGGWQSEETADEFIESLHNSRIFNRNIEAL